jgi:hypothetical protein
MEKRSQMVKWNYRTVSADNQHAIYEVFYDSDDGAVAWTLTPSYPRGESFEDLKEDFARYSRALSDPILSGEKIGLTTSTKQIVPIELTQSEALVLFEFLSRFTQDEKLEIQDDSEQRVLWSILATLEKNLVQPLAENYQLLLNEAQKKVKEADTTS